MSDNTKLKISNGLNEDKYSVKSKFVNFFLLAMFTLFPLFYIIFNVIIYTHMITTII